MAQTIDPTDISYVSINPYTNEVTVSWYKSTSANIAFVRIHYIYDETTLVKAKTIADIPQNDDDTLVFRTDSMSIFPYEAQDVPISFACDAYATNGDNSTSLREYHTTMHCTSVFQTCPSQIQISWTPYFAYGLSITKYQLIEVTNTNTETVLSDFVSTTNSAIVPINSSSSRRFFIRATFTDCRGIVQSSTSNMVTCITPILFEPAFIRTENIQVNAENDITLTFSIDTATSYTKYTLYRSLVNTNNFVAVESFDLAKTEISPLTYTHIGGFIQDSTSYYKLVAFDNCSNQIRTSNTITPINLSGTAIDETHHLLQWTNADFWTEGAAIYDVYRITNEVDETKILSATYNSKIDDITNNYKVDSKICYRVEAKQNRDSLPFTSISNTFCFEKDYRIVIPNALNPFSSIAENTVFKPKYAFVSGSYSMKIYTRTGDCIFETSNIETGWDGKIKGNYAPQGSYQYKIVIHLPTGEVIDRVGSISLVYQK